MQHTSHIYKRMIKSYIRMCDTTIYIPKKFDKSNPSNYISELTLHNFYDSVWILGSDLEIISNKERICIPIGYMICVDKELNKLVKFIMSGREYRTLICLVWCRDILEYDKIDTKEKIVSVMKCESIHPIYRMLITSLIKLHND